METKLITLIDKNKTNISDGDYVEICNILKKSHIKTKNLYLIKYYKLSFINVLNEKDVKQGSEIKNKKVIIDNDETLNKLNEMCNNIENLSRYKFNFIKNEDFDTYLVSCNNCHHNYHMIQTDEENEETIGIDYDEIFIIGYKKLEE